MRNLLLSLLGAMCLTTGQAFAFWDVQNSGEDVFGNVNVTATSVGDNGTLLRFECGSSSEPFIAFLIRDSSNDFPEIPAQFLHVDDAGDRQTTDASLTPWNDQYVAVRVKDKSMLKRVADHMIVASKSIAIGITVPNSEIRVADTFSPRGSTAAGKVLLKHCLGE